MMKANAPTTVTPSKKAKAAKTVADVNKGTEHLLS